MSKLMRAYHGDPDHLIVVHDELDIEPGTIRVKFGGGHAGHNGLRSICDKLGTRDWYRCASGIGRPPGRKPVVDWVLSRPRSKDDTEALRSRRGRGRGGALAHRQRAGKDPAAIQPSSNAVFRRYSRGARCVPRSFCSHVPVRALERNLERLKLSKVRRFFMHLSEKGHTYALFAIVVITCALGSLTQTVMNSMLTDVCVILPSTRQWGSGSRPSTCSSGVTVPVGHLIFSQPFSAFGVCCP